ncbi:MAG: hypothetical protein ACI86M_001418 [Saprospiraceae bacterium]|jgi:hypothetical protein
MKNALTLIFLASFVLFSCKSDSKAKETKQEIKVETQKKYTLTPFTPSKTFADAEIESMAYSAGSFDFTVPEGDYTLGQQTTDAPQKMCANSGKGQHIHLIIDNAPYAAKYTNKFDYEVEDGDHYLLAFLSRSYHESIKTDKAHVAKKVTVSNNGLTNSQPISDPMLFYSRPKGTYVGNKDTEKVMLDFYAVNANIGTTQKIIANINGEKHEITKWQPYYITGLPMGENTIELTLTDIEGYKIDTPLNPVTRIFTLKADPAE